MTTPPRIAYGHEIFVGSMFGRRAFGSRPPRRRGGAGTWAAGARLTRANRKGSQAARLRRRGRRVCYRRGIPLSGSCRDQMVIGEARLGRAMSPQVWGEVGAPSPCRASGRPRRHSLRLGKRASASRAFEGARRRQRPRARPWERAAKAARPARQLPAAPACAAGRAARADRRPGRSSRRTARSRCPSSCGRAHHLQRTPYGPRDDEDDCDEDAAFDMVLWVQDIEPPHGDPYFLFARALAPRTVPWRSREYDDDPFVAAYRGSSRAGRTSSSCPTACRPPSSGRTCRRSRAASARSTPPRGSSRPGGGDACSSASRSRSRSPTARVPRRARRRAAGGPRGRRADRRARRRGVLLPAASGGARRTCCGRSRSRGSAACRAARRARRAGAPRLPNRRTCPADFQIWRGAPRRPRRALRAANQCLRPFGVALRT